MGLKAGDVCYIRARNGALMRAGRELSSDKLKELPARTQANQKKAAFLAAKEAHDGFPVPRTMDLGATMASCAARVYASGTERHKTRVLLCHVYHHALHGHYQVARDQLLTSHLADIIHQFDISTQILYNRALVRCGICAFERRLLPQAHSALMELAVFMRMKRFLHNQARNQNSNHKHNLY